MQFKQGLSYRRGNIEVLKCFIDPQSIRIQMNYTGTKLYQFPIYPLHDQA